MDYTDQWLSVVQPQISQGSSWLADLRQGAVEQFATQGLPHARLENWKYTDVKALAKREFVLPKNAATQADALVAETSLALDGIRLVFVNGLFSAAHSQLDALPKGANVLPLADNANVAKTLLGQVAAANFSGFTALNLAAWQDGVVIDLAANTVVEMPIYLQFVSTEHTDACLIQPRILIKAGVYAQATVVEHFAGAEEAANFTNVVTEVDLADGAQITHYKLQQESVHQYHIASLHVQQQRDSRFTSHNICLGGKLARQDIQVELNAEGAEVNLNGLYLGNGRQHLDNHTLVNHNAPHTNSNEDYKGILNDRSRGVFNGRVVVHKNAQKIEAHQSNGNLLLSDKAEIDTKPELEIYADDVKCSHGSTTGQLDENALFALRSRGLDEAMARGLLTLAFANEVIDRIEIPAVHDRIELAVAGRLPEKFNLKGLV
ncbi:Fe-S cluster assembly protein SufD [Oceanospirillum multiglobuliferum]|uniref:Fe-S cluster assembly protein SufD n=2 Tax=Oceanospirillum multiglobuliferum TaxID=64969 RepID=A0A1V4T6Z6_9GAMM|nr:Fe-S cluster assembly protein SufD [Oceanospirillum multiglobuliferum]